jgi:hypothetical protein
MNDKINFTADQMSILAAVSYSIQCFMIIIYRYKLKYMGIRVMYFIIWVLALFVDFIPFLLTDTIPTFNNSTTCGTDPIYNATIWGEGLNNTCYYFQIHSIDPMLLALSDDLLGEVVDMLRNIPLTLVLIAVCGDDVEASTYSCIIGLTNTVILLNRYINAHYYVAWGITEENNYINLPSAILFSGALDALTGIFIPLLPYQNIPNIETEAQKKYNNLNIKEIVDDCIETSENIILEELKIKTQQKNHLKPKTTEDEQQYAVI